MRPLKSTFIAAFLLLPLAGCGRNSDMWREMARAYQIGTTYDKALIASRQGQSRQLRTALQRLEELDATQVAVDLQLDRAEGLVREAMLQQGRAMQTTQLALQRQMEAEAAQKYRVALRWSPGFPSKDPLLLNGLGYFLADQGHTNDDFTLSVELTSRAVAILGKLTDEQNRKVVIRGDLLRQVQQQQALTRDSLAWGLFKLGRLREAEEAQQKALREAKESGLQDEYALAELWWHQAQILKAQGQTQAARDALQQARRLQPGDDRFKPAP